MQRVKEPANRGTIPLGMVKAAIRMLPSRKIDDHVADVYGKVRDATICNDNIAPADCIAILELVKAELLRGVQAQIDEG